MQIIQEINNLKLRFQSKNLTTLEKFEIKINQINYLWISDKINVNKFLSFKIIII